MVKKHDKSSVVEEERENCEVFHKTVAGVEGKIQANKKEEFR